MTNTASLRRAPSSQFILNSPQVLSREAGGSLVEQIVHSVEARIDDTLLRTGARMPSIRRFAELHGVSRFTVVEAYDRLVAKGYLDSRRGSGFYPKFGDYPVVAAQKCVD